MIGQRKGSWGIKKKTFKEDDNLSKVAKLLIGPASIFVELAGAKLAWG